MSEKLQTIASSKIEVIPDHRGNTLKGTWVRLAKTLSRIERKTVTPEAAKMRVRTKNKVARMHYEKQIRKEVKEAEKFDATIRDAVRIIGEVVKGSSAISQLQKEKKSGQ